MTSRHDGDDLEVLLMARDDHFSEVVRNELRRRGIRFAEIDPGHLQGTVVPTLVVQRACGGEVTYEGFGRIRGEFLARYDAAPEASRLTARSPAGHAQPAATAR